MMRAMARPIPLPRWLAACALLACAARAQEPGDADVRRAWSFATDSEREDVLARAEAEAAELDTLQRRLLRAALRLDERDFALFPAQPPLEYYDPALHAPAQPIARRWLAPDSADAVRERARRLAHSAQRLRPAWCYDWALRDVVRCADREDVERRFENALAGFPPLLDLAQALVERALDGGEQAAALAAFAHAYTDRDGRVFPGVTLYDAWASGTEIEMPDVDVLGIVHELTGERRRWVAPVPARQHAELYRRVGELFAPAQRYRALRTAIARSFAVGSADLPRGYAAHLERFHALWRAHDSSPAAVAASLPGAAHESEFLERWTLACEEDAAVREAGSARRTNLDADARAVRALLVRALADVGAFERASRPEPKPAK
jgi:hypothetical protein